MKSVWQKQKSNAILFSIIYVYIFIYSTKKISIISQQRNIVRWSENCILIIYLQTATFFLIFSQLELLILIDRTLWEYKYIEKISHLKEFSSRRFVATAVVGYRWQCYCKLNSRLKSEIGRVLICFANIAIPSSVTLVFRYM